MFRSFQQWKRITNFWPIGVKEIMNNIGEWALKNQSSDNDTNLVCAILVYSVQKRF